MQIVTDYENTSFTAYPEQLLMRVPLTVNGDRIGDVLTGYPWDRHGMKALRDRLNELLEEDKEYEYALRFDTGELLPMLSLKVAEENRDFWSSTDLEPADVVTIVRRVKGWEEFSS
jgi:predicted house-cleaning noncanonical NTP pyrophosphatase (MazG superfamily)